MKAHANSYISYSVTAGAIQNAEAQNALNTQINTTQLQLTQLEQHVARTPAAKRAGVVASQADKRAALNATLATNEKQLNQLKAAAAVDKGGELLAPPPVPTTPLKPRPTRTALLGLDAGIKLGFAVAFLVDYFDNRTCGKENLERVSKHRPVVGLIPPAPGWRDPAVARVISVEDPMSVSTEAYRALPTSAQFPALDRSLKTIQATSPRSSEGKTATLVNLAVALARATLQVVVVDDDLRRPRLDRFFGLQPDPGFRRSSLAMPHCPGPSSWHQGSRDCGSCPPVPSPQIHRCCCPAAEPARSSRA